MDEVRSSGAANDVVVCGELAIFRQFSGFLAGYYLALSSEKGTSNFISRIEILSFDSKYYLSN